MKRYRMYLNGDWSESRTGRWLPVIDPSTEEIIAEVPDAGEADIDSAVQAARAAFDSGPWPQTTAQERGRLLFRLAERVRREAPQLAELEARDSGKPIVEAESDMNDVATCFEYYGGLATKVMGHVSPVPDNALSLSLREPVGVAAQIIPWNYPLLMAAWKLAPALAAGCTCVLKPAEQTPLTALELAGWLNEIGFPPGVVNIVTGFGETAGAPLERATKMGALVSKEQYERVQSYVAVGKQEAKLTVGGGRPAGLGRGYYIERVVKALRAGIVWVNHMQPAYVEAPWGGYKQSGFGRELGPWGIEEYLETKQVHINLNEQPIGWYS